MSAATARLAARSREIQSTLTSAARSPSPSTKRVRTSLLDRFVASDVPVGQLVAASSGADKQSEPHGRSAPEASSSKKGPSLEEILAENERLRKENEALRTTSHDAQGSAVASQDGESVTGNQEDARRPEPATLEDRLQPRGRGTPFNIREWSGDRRVQKRTQHHVQEPLAVDDDASTDLQLVAAGPSSTPAASFEASQASIGEETAASDAGVEAEQLMQLPPLRPISHSWIPQCSLLGASRELWTDHAELRALLEDSQRSLGSGSTEDAFVRFEKAFSLHLSSLDRPHLGFSAAIIPFLASLHEAALSQRQLDRHAAFSYACADCANLLRKLVAKAMYGNQPPKKRPQGVDRTKYVRELSAQIGLSLDLVRLAYVQRAVMKIDRKGAQRQDAAALAPLAKGPEVRASSSGSSTILPLTLEHLESHTQLQEDRARQAGEADHVVVALKQQSAMTQEPSWKQQLAVDRDEREFHLKRVGLYLKALQVDMDRENVDALYRAQGEADAVAAAAAAASAAAAAAKKRTADSEAVPGDASEEHAAACSSDAIVIATGEAVPKPEGKTSARKRTALQAAKLSSAARADSLEFDFPHVNMPLEAFPPATVFLRADMKLSEADYNLKPTFGQFLDRHVMPLYIADIPFASLRVLPEHYCGIPIDSDDESRIWDGVGQAARTNRPVAATRPAKATASSGRGGRADARRRGADPGVVVKSPAGRLVAQSPAAESRLVLDPSKGDVGIAGRGGRQSISSQADADAARTGRLDVLTQSSQTSMRPPAPVLRGQMLNSVVEKRRNSIAAHSGMTVPRGAARASTGGGRASMGGGGRASMGSARASMGGSRASTGGARASTGSASSSSAAPPEFPASWLSGPSGGEPAPVTPLRRLVSKALISEPAPPPTTPLHRSSGGGFDGAATPVTIRKSLASREDHHGLCSPVPGELAWGLMDTPR